MSEAAGTSMPASDAELLNTIRSGDSAPFDLLRARHAAAARYLAAQLLSDPAAADATVELAFGRVLDAIRRGGGPTDAFRPYLLTAVRRAAAGSGPVPVDDQQLPDPGQLLAGPAASRPGGSPVLQAFLSLPERWRAALWHTDIELATPAEAAPLLGLTAAGVLDLAGRARDGLARAYLQLRQSAGEPDPAALADPGAALREAVAPAVLGEAAAAYLAGLTEAGVAGAGGGGAGGARRYAARALRASGAPGPLAAVRCRRCYCRRCRCARHQPPWRAGCCRRRRRRRQLAAAHQRPAARGRQRGGGRAGHVRRRRLRAQRGFGAKHASGVHADGRHGHLGVPGTGPEYVPGAPAQSCRCRARQPHRPARRASCRRPRRLPSPLPRRRALRRPVPRRPGRRRRRAAAAPSGRPARTGRMLRSRRRSACSGRGDTAASPRSPSLLLTSGRRQRRRSAPTSPCRPTRP